MHWPNSATRAVLTSKAAQRCLPAACLICKHWSSVLLLLLLLGPLGLLCLVLLQQSAKGRGACLVTVL
jgi:hypothetical protein